MSEAFSAADAVSWSGGELLAGSGSTSIDSVAIDSRIVARGGLFCAIAGPNHDGHDFLPDVVESGAVALLVDRGRPLPPLPEDVAIVAVADTFDAITTSRPYQRAYEVEFALETIRKLAGTRFDAKVVTAFLRAVEAGDVQLRRDPAPAKAGDPEAEATAAT